MSKLVRLSNTNIYVSELKLKYVEYIISICKNFDFIDKVILFGSTLEERCKESSDIDIIIIGTKTKSKCLDSSSFRGFKKLLFEFDFSQEYDILYTNSLSKFSIELQDNLKRGVVIYEK